MAKHKTNCKRIKVCGKMRKLCWNKNGIKSNTKA